jgi:soluble lytic murein transglycosylase-like protein
MVRLRQPVAIAAAQFVLFEAGFSIARDGKFGPQTRGALLKAPPQVRDEANAILLSGGLAAESGVREGSRADIRALIATKARQLDVDPMLALTIAEAESGLDPKAVSPTNALGLFQLTTIAIKDVNLAFGTDFTPGVDDFLDPAISAEAGIRYIKLCARYAKVTPTMANASVIYSYYNIGPDAAAKLKRGVIDDAVRRSVANQASKLSSAGPENYLARVGAFLEDARKRVT